MSDELQLTPSGSHFSFNNFLNELNDAIPQTLSFKRKIETIRTVWPKVCNSLTGVIDDAHKTILIGIKKLPEDQRPVEKRYENCLPVQTARQMISSTLLIS
ncbi:hypothetical protein O5631_04515 [Escherichia coli]|nr:hypothetical protein [Escherichia coli]